MKILLVGEYSGLHWTLAQGLVVLGHDVTVASDGDGFKNYPRNINFVLRHENIFSKIMCLGSIVANIHKLKGFDVVQVVNPCFTRIHSINFQLYKYLKRHNEKVFLGAFGDDYYYLKMCLGTVLLRYNEFYVDDEAISLKSNRDMIKAWFGTKRGSSNVKMAQSCDGIIACLYEYYVSYEKIYKDKLHYIPLPINTAEVIYEQQTDPDVVSFFIGINTSRSESKGTDVLYEILQELQANYPTRMRIITTASVPYNEYVKLMDQANVVVDQLYAYSPAMNGLLALAKGKVLVGGGEPEMYDLLHEKKNRPIVNITPDQKQQIYVKMEKLLTGKKTISQLSPKGRTFVEDHHDYVKVAMQYVDVWTR